MPFNAHGDFQINCADNVEFSYVLKLTEISRTEEGVDGYVLKKISWLKLLLPWTLTEIIFKEYSAYAARSIK